MSFSRKGFHALQDKMDEVLPICPCCGKSAVWLTESHNGFSTVSCKFKCQQCGAVFSTEFDWFITSWKQIVTFSESGSDGNVLGLELGKSYRCGELNNKLTGNHNAVFEEQSVARPLSPAEHAAVFGAVAAKKKKVTAVIVFVVIFLISFGLVFGLLYEPPLDGSEVGTPEKLTYANFSKISDGMSYSAVCDLLGGEGTYMSGASSGGYSFVIYAWSNYSGTKIVTVGFENGRVISKAQAGLQ